MLRKILFVMLMTAIFMLVPAARRAHGQGGQDIPRIEIGGSMTGVINAQSTVRFQFTATPDSAFTLTWRSTGLVEGAIYDREGRLIVSSRSNLDLVSRRGEIATFGPVRNLTGGQDYIIALDSAMAFRSQYTLTLTAEPYAPRDMAVEDYYNQNLMALEVLSMAPSSVACTDTEIFFVLSVNEWIARQARQVLVLETTGNVFIENIIPVPTPNDVGRIVVEGLTLEVGMELAGMAVEGGLEELLEKSIPFVGVALAIPELIFEVQEAIDENERIGIHRFVIRNEGSVAFDPNLRFLVWARRPAASAGTVMLNVFWAGEAYEIDPTTVTMPTVPYGEGDRLILSHDVCQSLAGVRTETGLPSPSYRNAEGEDNDDTRASLLTSNRDWSPRIETIDGVQMAYVPPGLFMMGNAYDDYRVEEWPPHEQVMETPYYIDRYEVTFADFAAFLNDAFPYYDLRSDLESYLVQDDDGTWGVQAGYENFPVFNVSWVEARNFCAWRGGRLPTEREWEYAASGPSNWQYPWGNDFVFEIEQVIYESYDGPRPAPVGSVILGQSWVGAQDMAGNVEEWTSSLLMPYPYDSADGRDISSGLPQERLAVRGGNFVAMSGDLTTFERRDAWPDERDSGRGFRCVRDVE